MNSIEAALPSADEPPLPRWHTLDLEAGRREAEVALLWHSPCTEKLDEAVDWLERALQSIIIMTVQHFPRGGPGPNPWWNQSTAQVTQRL